MVIIIPLVILCTWWAVMRLLRRTQLTRTAALTRPSALHPTPPAQADGLTWTALDDLQLTRLLTESARRSDTE